MLYQLVGTFICKIGKLIKLLTKLKPVMIKPSVITFYCLLVYVTFTCIKTIVPNNVCRNDETKTVVTIVSRVLVVTLLHNNCYFSAS